MISELHDFQGHPFKVEHDMQLFELSKSIEEKGVLVPLIVRPNPIGSVRPNLGQSISEFLSLLLHGFQLHFIGISFLETSKKSICGIFDHNVQTENVKISELHDFQGHPFKVEHDMQLFELSKCPPTF